MKLMLDGEGVTALVTAQCSRCVCGRYCKAGRRAVGEVIFRPPTTVLTLGVVDSISHAAREQLEQALEVLKNLRRGLWLPRAFH